MKYIPRNEILAAEPPVGAQCPRGKERRPPTTPGGRAAEANASFTKGVVANALYIANNHPSAAIRDEASRLAVLALCGH
jgi:hypothetical protein